MPKGGPRPSAGRPRGPHAQTGCGVRSLSSALNLVINVPQGT